MNDSEQKTSHETGIKQVSPYVWTWSVFNEEKKMNFNGWYVQCDGETALIDPPEPNDHVFQLLGVRGIPDNILLTNKHHTRFAESFREEFDCPIWIHEYDEQLMDIPVDRVFQDGDVLSCGLRVINLHHGKTNGESAFYLKKERPTMIVGDAVIGHPTGFLSMLPDQKFEDPALAKMGLNRLLEFPFDMLLVGDGESILTGAHQTLKNFLSDA